MSSFTFLIAVLLLSCLTTRGRTAVVTLSSYTIPGNDLRGRCTFDLNGYVFDLCPLLGSTKVVEVPEKSQDEGPSSGRYVLALGGFGKESDVVKNPGCDEETWVCLITTSTFVLALPAQSQIELAYIYFYLKRLKDMSFDRNLLSRTIKAVIWILSSRIGAN
jgi:hypothetical protein